MQAEGQEMARSLFLEKYYERDRNRAIFRMHCSLGMYKVINALGELGILFDKKFSLCLARPGSIDHKSMLARITAALLPRIQHIQW